jgi:hypothetical protein
MAEIGFRRESIPVEVGGNRVVVPYRCADEWLSTLNGNPISTLLALVRETTSEDLISGLAAGEITPEQLAKASYSLFEQACPYKWWESYRLLLTSTSRDTVGRMALAGLDPAKMSVGVWCCATYAILTKGADQKERFKFDGQLSIPPEGIEDDWEDDSFNTMVQQARTMPGMR